MIGSYGSAAEALVTGELHLLALLRRRCVVQAAAQPAQALPVSEAEWQALLAAAQAQRVSPLLYRIVYGTDLAPTWVVQSLQLAYYETLQRNMVMFSALEQMLVGLAEAGIDAILLKGAALAEGVYGNLGLRPMDDLDLLIRREDARRAADVLSGQGCAPAVVDLYPGYTLAYGDQLALRNTRFQGCAIELHWYLLNPLRYQPLVPMEWFWSSRSRISVGQVEARVLDPEAQLLHLCAHTWMHICQQEGRLLWLHDVAEVVAHFSTRIDWDLLLAQAARSGLLEGVEETLSTVRERWGAPVPEEVVRRAAALRTGPRYRPVRAKKIGLAHIRGWQARARAVWLRLTPSAEYMRDHHHIVGRVQPWHYLRRWLKGVTS